MAAPVVRFLATLSLLVLGALVGASAVLGFRAHPELWLPLVLVALAAAGVAQLGRWARAAATEAVGG